MGQNRKKHRLNSHLIYHCPTSEGVSRVSGASDRVNERASGPVLQSVFLFNLAYSAISDRLFFYSILTSLSGDASVRPSVRPSVFLTVRPSFHLSVFLSIRLSDCLSFRLISENMSINTYILLRSTLHLESFSNADELPSFFYLNKPCLT